ncbi:uncharacterized protein LOC122278619 [Carya illinoinensis]|uniref:uncharacterized protein LOC122278619 n=1 Tax=Carya illinoinensis TaxID=32201 RepID=UPI001C71838D|nr:uncharacterized protein LOC122278619 [Carya illinoinensis]
MTERLHKHELDEAGMIARQIWTKRNEFIHDKGFRHPNSVIYKAISDLRLFKRAVTITESAKWRKPIEGKYKLNWDASINDSRGLIGIGTIIRDSYGRVLGTLRARRNMKLSPFAAEAYALMIAVLFSKEASFSEVHLEGDSLQVVEKLKKPAEDWSLGGLMIEDIKIVLRSFVLWTVCHTGRDANMVAHMLAKDAILSEVDHYDLK